MADQTARILALVGVTHERDSERFRVADIGLGGAWLRVGNGHIVEHNGFNRIKEVIEIAALESVRQAGATVVLRGRPFGERTFHMWDSGHEGVDTARHIVSLIDSQRAAAERAAASPAAPQVIRTRTRQQRANSTASPPAAPAGWYPDPQSPDRQRYWDGNRWQ